MKFLDEAIISIESGSGGKGCVSFRREKYIPRGGPDGGAGGKGGDIIFVADRNMTTLLDFHYKRSYKALSGKPGLGQKKSGANGDDLKIHVPVGTFIKDQRTGEVLVDLNEDGAQYIALAGGRGGKGNSFFKSSIQQTPQRSQTGESGQKKEILLELKLLADVAIIGFPNVGKSTLLSKVTGSKPKIADYAFTTLSPNLGVVELQKNGERFTIADIPGLIEGAHLGAGLGIKFLKHIERTRLFWHLLDATHIETELEFQKINHELEKYNTKLTKKPQIIVLNKIDLLKRTPLSMVRKFRKQGYDVVTISALRSQNVSELVDMTMSKLNG